MALELAVKGQIFRKSKYSAGNAGCVGVAIEKDRVSVLNTKTQVAIVDFTHAEWEIFLRGVKDGEFDLAFSDS